MKPNLSAWHIQNQKNEDSYPIESPKKHKQIPKLINVPTTFLKIKNKKRAYDAGVFVGIALIHLDIFAANEQESEMAILVADGVDAQMINPAEVISSFSLLRPSALRWSFPSLRRRSLAPELPECLSRRHLRLSETPCPPPPLLRHAPHMLYIYIYIYASRCDDYRERERRHCFIIHTSRSS